MDSDQPQIFRPLAVRGEPVGQHGDLGIFPGGLLQRGDLLQGRGLSQGSLCTRLYIQALGGGKLFQQRSRTLLEILKCRLPLSCLNCSFPTRRVQLVGHVQQRRNPMWRSVGNCRLLRFIINIASRGDGHAGLRPVG